MEYLHYIAGPLIGAVIVVAVVSFIVLRVTAKK